MPLNSSVIIELLTTYIMLSNATYHIENIYFFKTMIDLMATRLCHVSLMRYLWNIYIVCSITSYIEKSTHTSSN
jgi:hypothetical protein